ncbi:flagellar hook-basal body complex protein FliE [Paenibacillus sp. J2TS4]|uniref:flagellar hook-basal body complex protein FliE n=1 Tax=Paenibacillus sp. J2TS4 TaxID=2807194 RepID=UPI001B1CFD65|nr:flagellar hook-basal body complex protein FliE [Paenibacillus sp. J2TS4]GIP33063.1 hypothetical protein J2TS4_22730 [Paenibacillus sp. J2TS4]
MINQLTFNTPAVGAPQPEAAKASVVGAMDLTQKFDQFLRGAIADLNQQQHQVEGLNEQFIKGEVNDVHQLMIASAKAELGLQLTVQVRNKVVEAYQDVMRMQL